MSERLRVSFEFFPPKTAGSEEQLWDSIQKLAPLKPTFVSVTYGAGGSTRERTHKTVNRLLAETDLDVAAHLTCVDARREEVDQVLHTYWENGVRHIVALRGDPPSGTGAPYLPCDGGYPFADALIKGAKSLHDFEVTVGCYPEVHPEASSAVQNIEVLKAKVDAGATRAITQFFYDNDSYLRFVDAVRDAGIDIPIIPGIMPVTNYTALKKMAQLCGTKIPDRFAQLFEPLEHDVETRKMVSASLAAEQCLALAEQGVEDFHFYTLNRSELTFALCHMLDVRPAKKALAA